MNFIVYTDGACRGNQFDKNIGAYAYTVFSYPEPEKRPKIAQLYDYSEAIPNTTNNQMELLAVIKALEYIITTYPTDLNEVTIYSDSTYVVMGLTTWYTGWIKRGWKSVKNVELWKKLITLKKAFRKITLKHVPGHSGNKYNELVDSLCNKAMDEYEEKNKLK